MHRWDEIGAGVYRLRCATYHLNVAVVTAADGLLLVDTRANLVEAAELRADIAALSRRPVRWVVNTHVHYDHTFGNAEFVPPRQDPGAQLWAHVNAIENYPAYADAARAELIEEGGAEAVAMRTQEFAAPTHGIDARHVLDLGDRSVEISYHGRGHTDGDLVLAVPDADVLIAGDLVKQHGPPSHWPDCFPLDWPETLRRVQELTGPSTVVLPGHGEVVDGRFVAAQRADLQAVADEVERLFRAGVPAADAVGEGRWPYDSPRLPTAVRRGYQQLTRPGGARPS